MKSGHCPMCDSNEVYANPKAQFWAGSQFVDLEDELGLMAYVCAECGFIAMYADEMDDLKSMIKGKGWTKVTR